MPINNTYFGLWKVFTYGGVKYVVESANESVKQEINPKQYIIGTAMPRVLEVKGATAEIEITAPLLVHDQGPRTGKQIGFGDFVQDGFTMITDYGSFSGIGAMTPSFTRDPFFIFRNVTFSVSNEQGATYKISAIGDYNALASENTAPASYKFGLIDPITGAPGGTPGYPTFPNTVYRVASFYDIEVFLGSSFSTMVQDVSVSVDYTIQPFSFLGQTDQRMWYGVSAMSATVSGTAIGSTRVPLAQDMKLQATARTSSTMIPPAGTPTFGGMAWPTDGTLTIKLRNGTSGGETIDIMPNLGLNSQKFIFSTSSFQASTGLLTTKFEGQMWAKNNS